MFNIMKEDRKPTRAEQAWVDKHGFKESDAYRLTGKQLNELAMMQAKRSTNEFVKGLGVGVLLTFFFWLLT